MKLTIAISRKEIRLAKSLLRAERHGEMLESEDAANMAAGRIVISAIAAAETKKDLRAPAGICRRCGCTQERGCPVGCGWFSDNLCTACVVPGDRRLR